MKLIMIKFLAAVVIVFGLGGTAFAIEVNLAMRDITVYEWECVECRMKIRTLTDYGRFMTNRKHRNAPVLDELDKYFKDQARHLTNFFSGSSISQCSKGEAKYNKAHRFTLLNEMRRRPDHLLDNKSMLYYLKW